MPSAQISRLSISRKKRFEIFKRDGFKCQYCGAYPPDVILEVDHITPVCRGGVNNDNNLVTSCFDCNRGKGGHPLSDIIVSWKTDASRIAEQEGQIEAYRQVLEARRARIDNDAYAIFKIIMPDVDPGEDWIASIKGFMGDLEYEELIDSAAITFRKGIIKSSKAFSYFCGVCWRKIERKKHVL